LIAIDGNDIRSPQSIRSAIRSSEDRVTVTLFRSGRMLSVDVRLNHNRPDPGEGAFEPEPLRPRLPENAL
jgi:hypothetical protein